MKKLSPENVHLVHRSKRSRLTTEDFVLLVVHSHPDTQKKIVDMLKKGDFTTYADTGAKGAIGSALMFTPNVIIFDWNADAAEFQKTHEFIRSQKLAKHIAKTNFIVTVSSDAPDKSALKVLEDPNVILIEYSDLQACWLMLRKHVFNLFRKAQHELQQVFEEDDSVAASKQRQTASINEILQQNKNFSESVIRTFELLVKKVTTGDSQKIFDTVTKTLELLNRPFVLRYRTEDGRTYETSMTQGQNIQKLKELLENTENINNTMGGISKLNSDQDRRCFFGEDKKLYFATDSPIVFDELDNLSVVTKNFEMFLIQAEKRSKQLKLMEHFKEMFKDLYNQMEGFEWSESLEEMHEVVNQMFAMDSFEEEEEEEAVAGELELF